ncbi:unnamed protein product [Rotaria sordida]|uniref:Legumain n=1 Tax=Rotaria sordida TaxID=392033 RepID=A0A819DAA2_9BILA|nr:unnamed protein product [Rotaria sordida]
MVQPQTIDDCGLRHFSPLCQKKVIFWIYSGPDDNVFVFFTDHGAVGLVAFPTGVMVIYIEACESGSMLEGLLPANINVYGTTASSAEEPSYACYYDAKRGTYLGDVYSVAWMEDSDAEQINKESLLTQYQVAKKNTNTSHVMQYGDLNLGKSHNVSEFQGAGTQPMKPIRNPFTDRYNDLLKRDAVATVDVRVSTVVHRLDNSESAVEKAALKRELVQLLNKVQYLDYHQNH